MAVRDVRNFKFLKEAIIQKFRNPENPSFKGIRYEPVANPNSIFGRIYTTFRELIDKKHLDLKQYLNIGDKSVLERLYLNLKKDANLKFLDDPDSTLSDQKYELSDQYFQGQSKDVTAAQQAEPVPVAHAGIPSAPTITTTPSQPRFIHNMPQIPVSDQIKQSNAPTEKTIESGKESIKPEVPQAFQKAFEGEPAEVLHPDRQPVPETFNKAFENEPPLNPDKQTSPKTNPFAGISAINPGVRFQSGPSDILKTTGSKTGTFFKTNSNRVAGSLGDIFKGIGRGIAGPGVSGLYNAGARIGNGSLNAIERISRPGGAGGGGIGKLSKSSNKVALVCLGLFFLLVLLGLFGATSGTTPSTGTIPTTNTASSCLLVNNPNDYIQNTGFLPKDDTGYPFANPTNYSAAYTAAAQKAKAAATSFSGVDPILLVWWVFFETGAKYDSYSYSNCLDNNHDVNTNCSSVGSGRWQLGYGQQYADTIGKLAEAFQKTKGDPNNATLTQQVGQNVLNQAGQTSHIPFPNTSVNALLADTSQDAQYWKSVLMRDPDISMYLLAYKFSAYAGQNLREITAQWGGYYTVMWQKASNLLSDILAYNQTNCQTQSSITSPGIATDCPIPNGVITCGSQFTPVTDPYSNEICGHCGIGYPPESTNAYCGYPGTKYAIDVAGSDLQTILLPKIGGNIVTWAYLGEEAGSTEAIQKYTGSVRSGSAYQTYYLQLHHTQLGSGNPNAKQSGDFGGKICGGGCNEKHTHIQIGSGGDNAGSTGWLDAAQYFCRK